MEMEMITTPLLNCLRDDRRSKLRCEDKPMNCNMLVPRIPIDWNRITSSIIVLLAIPPNLVNCLRGITTQEDKEYNVQFHSGRYTRPCRGYMGKEINQLAAPPKLRLELANTVSLQGSGNVYSRTGPGQCGPRSSSTSRSGVMAGWPSSARQFTTRIRSGCI